MMIADDGPQAVGHCRIVRNVAQPWVEIETIVRGLTAHDFYCDDWAIHRDLQARLVGQKETSCEDRVVQPFQS